MRHLRHSGGQSVLAVLALVMVGCSDEAKHQVETQYRPDPAPASAVAPVPAFSGYGMQGGMGNLAMRKATSPPAAAGAEDDTSKATKAATDGRKIIYNAQVDLVTEDLTAFDGRLSQLIATSKGYVADSDITGSAGSTRRGSWKVRVPVETYDAFLKGAVALGELVTLKANSEDVSEEFFDLEARQTNKKVEETRLLKHLTDSTGKLDEILTVERELSRVRGEIERMQGRLRAMANLSSLTTITITAREIKDYAPPQAPTFTTKVARAFANSLDSLRQTAEGFALFVVGILPWVPVIAVGLVILIWVARRRFRRHA